MMDDTMNAMTMPTLTGQRVTLRGVQPKDEQARLSLGWHAAVERNDAPQVQTRQMTPAEARAWYEQQQARAADKVAFGLDDPVAPGRVGGAGLDSLKRTDRKAHFVIGMFAPSHMRRGLGTQATRLVLAHAFGSMNLHRVDLRVLAFNDGAIASYRKCGFVQEGRERDSCWFHGQWHDDVIMGVLATEFPGPR